jgi:hypothetical protein
MRPRELPLIQPSCDQQDANAVVNQDSVLSCGWPGDWQTDGMVRMRGAEHRDHPGPRRIETGPHVQWMDRQPHLINANHASHSRSQAAHCAASDVSQLTVIDGSARRTSMRILAGHTFRVSRSTGRVLHTTAKAINGVGHLPWYTAPLIQDVY